MLACGYEGIGRLWKVDEIAFRAEFLLARRRQVDRVKFLVTAGPTREPLDPVRYLSNRSSGKMGYAIAAAALEEKHEVTLDQRPGRDRRASWRGVGAGDDRRRNVQRAARGRIAAVRRFRDVRRGLRLQTGEIFAQEK